MTINSKPKIFAHRGAKAAAPENTIPAFQRALEMGVDGVELDAQITKDGQLAVIHDFDVDKTTSGTGPVSQFTAAELAALDAGSHFSAEYADVGVPMLPEVLDLLQNQMEINVEIKSQDRQGGPEVELVLDLIRERDLYESVLISSFNPITLIKTRYLDKQVRIGFLYYEPLQPHLAAAWTSDLIRPQALHPYAELVDDALIAWASQNGWDVNTWTVNDVAEAQRLANLGVTTLMSDVPDQLMAALRG